MIVRVVLEEIQLAEIAHIHDNYFQILFGFPLQACLPLLLGNAQKHLETITPDATGCISLNTTLTIIIRVSFESLGRQLSGGMNDFLIKFLI